MPSLLHAVTNATGLSRRKAFAAIRDGRVRVDGVTRTDPSGACESGSLTMDGRAFATEARPDVYLLLNKPPGFITTVSDDMGRQKALDLIPEALRVPGLHPVGRLDRDTSGLLLLTTDGDLTYSLTHPSFEVEKEYWLRPREPLTEQQIGLLRQGVEIDGALRRPRRLRRLVGAEPFELSITIREGRNRQIRRMLEAVDAGVSALRRVREGQLALDDLPEGSVRHLSQDEVDALRAEAGSAKPRARDSQPSKA